MPRQKKNEIGTIEKLTVKENVIADMKGIGVYKPEYENVITIYADLLTQYAKANVDFEKSGYKYETSTAAGGVKKSAIVATLENLRKDILAYSDRLCLNPKAFDSTNIKPAPTKSKLDNVMDMLNND